MIGVCIYASLVGSDALFRLSGQPLLNAAKVGLNGKEQADSSAAEVSLERLVKRARTQGMGFASVV